MATKSMAEYLKEHKDDKVEIKNGSLYVNGENSGYSVNGGNFYRDKKSGDLIKMK